MTQAPTKAPAGTVGPTSLASKIYPPLAGKANVGVASDVADPWRGGAAATPNGAVATKGAVPVKVAANAPGNQGTKNSHTKPDAIKPTGSDAAMRNTESVTSTTALQKKASSRVYPHLNN